MWNAGLYSDDVLSEEIISKTEKWLKNLQSYPILMYRYVFFNQVGEIVLIYIHTFYWCLPDAFGGVIFSGVSITDLWQWNPK